MEINAYILGDIEPWAEDLFPDQPIMFERLPYHPAWGSYGYARGKLRVTCSARTEADGKRWMHVSCGRPDRLPSWDELVLVKETFIGAERLAIQVIPPRAQHVNIHPNVLHLWCCLDGDPTPDFRVNGQV